MASTFLLLPAAAHRSSFVAPAPTIPNIPEGTRGRTLVLHTIGQHFVTTY